MIGAPIVAESADPTVQPMSPTDRERPSHARPITVFMGILAVLYLPLFFGRIIFTRDIAHWIFPASWFVRQSLRAGELPVWNPYQGLGFPILGDPLYGIFYPPNWLLLLVPDGWVAHGVTALAFAHMAWGGLGVYVLARRLRAAPIAALVSGLAWSLSGYITAQWTAGLLLHAGAWIPWTAVGHLVLLDSLRAGGRRRALVKAALPTAFALLMGEVFLAVMGVGLATGLLALVQIGERRDHPEVPRLRPRWLAMHALAVALAVVLAAVDILPARAVMAGSPRASAMALSDAETSSLHPLRVLEFVAPGSMGDVYGDYPAARIVGEPRLDGLPLSYSVYLGASVLGLALMALRRRGLVLGLAGLTTLALLTAFGRHLPVHAVIRRLVPPLAYMRSPEKYTTLVVVGVAILAGLGAHRVLFEDKQPWRRTAILLAALVVLAATAPFLFPYPWSGFMFVGLRHGIVAVLALLGVQALAARGSRLAAPMLVALVVLDLATSTWGLQTFVPRALASVTPASATWIKADHGAHVEPPRIYRSLSLDTVLNRRAAVTNAADGELRLLATLTPNTANVWGVATLPGYDAAVPQRLNDLWEEGRGNSARRLSVLRLFGADYVVLPDRGDGSGTIAGVEPFADPLLGARLYRVKDSLPTVFVVGRGEGVSDHEGMARILDPTVVAGEMALLPTGTAPLDGETGRAGDCTMLDYGARRLKARCRVTREALAVFVEQYDPGWRADIDGKPAEVLRANLIMRAVRLPVGEHVITLEYHAPGFTAGLVVSLFGLACLLGLIATRERRRS
jgi:hypothetical protein